MKKSLDISTLLQQMPLWAVVSDVGSVLYVIHPGFTQIPMDDIHLRLPWINILLLIDWDLFFLRLK